MNPAAANTTIIEGYVGLLSSLSADNKLDLIARLTASIKADLTEKPAAFQNAFGAFTSDKSAEEVIAEVRDSRRFNRQIEDF